MTLTTIGNAAQGGTEDPGYSGAVAAIQVVIPKDGKIVSSQAWVRSVTNNTPSRMALYADSAGNPGALRLKSPDVVVLPIGASKQLYNLVGPVTAGTYWLAVGFDVNAAGISIFSDAGTHVYNLTNGSCPDPFGAPTAQGTLSMGVSLTFDDSTSVVSWFRRRIRQRRR